MRDDFKGDKLCSVDMTAEFDLTSRTGAQCSQYGIVANSGG